MIPPLYPLKLSYLFKKKKKSSVKCRLLSNEHHCQLAGAIVAHCLGFAFQASVVPRVVYCSI